MSFEEDVARLEAIASELEGEGVTLDHALELFEEGVTRLRRAAAELGRAQTKVALLVEQVDGAFALRPLRKEPKEGAGGLPSGGGRVSDSESGGRR